MENLSKKLEVLFRQYLIRKEKEKQAPSRCYPGYQDNGWMEKNESYNGIIYFYELSDINRSPVLFYNIGAFDTFLRRYGIYMLQYQRDVIKQLERSYITCKTGTRNLLIRGTKEMLVDALKTGSNDSVNANTAEMAVMNTRRQFRRGMGLSDGMAVMNTPVPCYPGMNPGGSAVRLPAYCGNPDEWYG